MQPREPIFNVPKGVLWAALLMLGVQTLLALVPEERAAEILLALAFIPARYSGAAGALPGGYAACFTSPFTYMIVHAGWLHLGVNLLWMLAFGSAVARRLGTMRFFAFSIVCGLAGALTHLAFHVGQSMPVVGASAAIAGQMAGAFRFVFRQAPAAAEDLALPDARFEIASLKETLTDKRMWLIFGTWVGTNLLFGAGGVAMPGAEGPIAWEAHIGGFVCGLLIFGLFHPPQASRAVLPDQPL